MTNQEAIAWIKSIKDKYIHGGDDDFDEKRKKSLDIAIKAIEDIDKIKSIISTHENLLELDVMRYKMICEVIANDE